LLTNVTIAVDTAGRIRSTPSWVCADATDLAMSTSSTMNICRTNTRRADVLPGAP